MIKFVIFDWDGTLADSIGQIIACKVSLAKKYNLTLPSEEIIKNVLGMKFETALETCFPNVSSDDLSKIRKEFDGLMQTDNSQASLFPEANTVLNILKKRGTRLAIATSKSRKWLDKAIKYNNLVGEFDITCCGEEYEEKPNPAMLEHIIMKFNLAPQECLMVGDTTTDILFANNAGIRAIGVTFGAHSMEKLKSLAPLALINEWGQLPEVIEKLCS